MHARYSIGKRPTLEPKVITASCSSSCSSSSRTRSRSTVFGRLSARDLFLILSDQAVAEGTTEDELQALLDTLASPLLGVLQGSKDDGYLVTTSAEGGRRRIEIVAQQLATSEPRA